MKSSSLAVDVSGNILCINDFQRLKIYILGSIVTIPLVRHYTVQELSKLVQESSYKINHRNLVQNKAHLFFTVRTLIRLQAGWSKSSIPTSDKKDFNFFKNIHTRFETHPASPPTQKLSEVCSLGGGGQPVHSQPVTYIYDATKDG